MRRSCSPSTRARPVPARSCSTTTATSSRRRSASSRSTSRAPGWVEHDAEEIWATQAATIAEVLARARASADDVAAIGITNQRETTVLWDRATGRPVHRAIVWQDRRTADLCARFEGRRATRPRSRAAPACCSTRTSPAPSSRGCSTAIRRCARAPSAASSHSARSTAGSSGSSPTARSTSPTRPTRAARCC